MYLLVPSLRRPEIGTFTNKGAQDAALGNWELDWEASKIIQQKKETCY